MAVHFKSVTRAGGAVAVAGLILGFVATIPFRRTVGIAAGPDPIGLLLGLAGAFPSLGCLMTPLLGLGFVALPVGAGLGYGYQAQGTTNLALGGALTGVFGGLVYGIASGLVSLATHTGGAAFLQDVDALARTGNSALIGVLISLAVAILVGLVFGAVGGALSPALHRRANRSAATDATTQGE